jgi:hypothetical protein
MGDLPAVLMLAIALVLVIRRRTRVSKPGGSL